jgi:sialidase-1
MEDSGVCSTCYACVLKSEKAEANGSVDREWNFSGIGQQYSRESQLVQTMNKNGNMSSIYLNSRNFSPTPGHRYFARSLNGADHFSEFGLERSLIEPVTKSWTGVVCSLVRMSSRPSRILFSGPSNSTVRANLTLHLSFDEGETWPISRVLFPGLSAYSDLTRLGTDGSKVGLIFENGEETFADRISVVVLSLSWLQSIE